MSPRWRDNEGSLGGTYGIAGNETSAWLLARGHGELLALSPRELSQPMKAPHCPSPTSRGVDYAARCYVTVSEPCGKTMLYRPDGWACYDHETPVRLPLGMLLQDEPRYIDRGHGPEPLERLTPAELVALAGREIDVVYAADEPGGRAYWRYEVRR